MEGVFLRWGDTVTYLNTRDFVDHIDVLSSALNPVSADKKIPLFKDQGCHKGMESKGKYGLRYVWFARQAVVATLGNNGLEVLVIS